MSHDFFSKRYATSYSIVTYLEFFHDYSQQLYGMADGRKKVCIVYIVEYSECST